MESFFFFGRIKVDTNMYPRGTRILPISPLFSKRRVPICTSHTARWISWVGLEETQKKHVFFVCINSYVIVISVARVARMSAALTLSVSDVSRSAGPTSHMVSPGWVNSAHSLAPCGCEELLCQQVSTVKTCCKTCCTSVVASWKSVETGGQAVPSNRCTWRVMRFQTSRVKLLLPESRPRVGLNDMHDMEFPDTMPAGRCNFVNILTCVYIYIMYISVPKDPGSHSQMMSKWCIITSLEKVFWVPWNHLRYWIPIGSIYHYISFISQATKLSPVSIHGFTLFFANLKKSWYIQLRKLKITGLGTVSSVSSIYRNPVVSNRKSLDV